MFVVRWKVVVESSFVVKGAERFLVEEIGWGVSSGQVEAPVSVCEVWGS